eukprot:1375815-Amphidinium_carterae.1
MNARCAYLTCCPLNAKHESVFVVRLVVLLPSSDGQHTGLLHEQSIRPILRQEDRVHHKELAQSAHTICHARAACISLELARSLLAVPITDFDETSVGVLQAHA